MNELQRLRFDFERGLCTRDDVRAWVERQVVALATLPSALLELATLAHLDDATIAQLLRALGGSAPAADEARRELTAVATLFRRGSWELRQTIDSLLNLLWAEQQGLNEVEREQISDLEVAYALAVEGRAGTLEDVRSKVKAFLDEY